MLLNRYDVRRGTWRVLQHPLIAGEGQRNAYPNQLAVDARGGWHLSWVWRESPDVASNHDVMYAFSPDEGRSWRTSAGATYALPITAATAEVAWRVPQGSELINQTSMAVDAARRPLIATYWRDPASEVPQLRLVWHDGARWRASQVGTRTSAFRLSGGGTKRIPLSRPQVLARGDEVLVVYRDAERGGGDLPGAIDRPGPGDAGRRWSCSALPSASGSRRTTWSDGVGAACCRCSCSESARETANRSRTCLPSRPPCWIGSPDRLVSRHGSTEAIIAPARPDRPEYMSPIGFPTGVHDDPWRWRGPRG